MGPKSGSGGKSLRVFGPLGIADLFALDEIEAGQPVLDDLLELG